MKMFGVKLLWGFALLILLVFASGFIVSPENYTVSERTYHIPTDSVWNTLIKIEQYPEWRHDLDSVLKKDSLNWTEWTLDEDSASYTIDSVFSKQWFSYKMADTQGVFHFSYRYRITKDSAGSAVSLEEKRVVENPLLRTPALLFMNPEKLLNERLNDLDIYLSE